MPIHVPVDRRRIQIAYRGPGEAGSVSPRAEMEREALMRVAAAVAGANDLDGVLELAAEEALRAIGAASLTISRYERERTRYRSLINVGHLADWEERHPLDETYDVSRFPRLVAMASSARPYFNSLDDPECDRASAAFLHSVGKSSDLGVAIVVEEEVWGGVWASTLPSDQTFRSEDVRFLEAIGGQLAAAITRAELFSKVSRLAYTDSLTGLANRRALEERLERALTRFDAGGTGVALLLCDVDKLKSINDSSGHGRGDEALRHVAAALVAAAADHPGSFVARLGGDEFCVLLESREEPDPGTELDPIEELASSAQRLLAIDEPLIMVSCGVASADGSGTVAELLRAADTAQYVAKRRGGNRICAVAQGGEGPEPQPSAKPAAIGPAARRLATATAAVSERLAGDLASTPALERLDLVAATFSRAGEMARWAISVAEPGTTHLRDVSLGDNRDRPGTEARVVAGYGTYERYELDDFPQTAALVAAGSGSFVARVDDPSTDPDERALLEREGFVGVVAAAAGSEEGVYLVELVSDDPDVALELIEAPFAMAVRAAIPAQPHQRTGAAASARDRLLELSLALADRLSGATAEREVYAGAVEEIRRAFGCDAVHLVEVVDERLVVRKELGPFRTPAGWSQGLDSGLMGRCLRDGEPVLASDTSREPQYRTSPSTRDMRSELVVPLTVAGEPWGVLDLQDAAVDAFTAEDARLLESVAAQVGGALTAIGLYERLDRAYVGTAEALSEALEAKDSYTARHSRSIAENAVSVGRRLDIEGGELRMLRYAAAFHDIGKLAISREVLNKPGPLSAEEWAEMARHTIVGERILAPIEFLAPIRPIVRSAHERWDGAGYPDGLAGEESPLSARILFACDADDAMTTDRAYRAAMPAAEARRNLLTAGGSQLDPKIVQALLEVLDRAPAPVPPPKKAARSGLVEVIGGGSADGGPADGAAPAWRAAQGSGGPA